MNDKEFRLLHCQYCADPEQITRKELYSLIDYLHKENAQYLETIQEISEQHDRDQWSNQRDNEPHNYKEDLD